MGPGGDGGGGRTGSGARIVVPGFREVLVDQPFAGKWLEVDMNLGGGGHRTFQGTKFSDFAGGFSYKPSKFGGSDTVTRQRSIYWRTLNDTLELTEISLHLNLVDGQVRYIFQGSPILGPITIQETETSVVILVPTLTSLNRFIFTHPRRLADSGFDPYKQYPSIFHQICNKPQMHFRSFNLYEHAINIPVPLAAACLYLERSSPVFKEHSSSFTSQGGGESLFALSFESGSILVYRIGRDDVLQMYDLRQANLFTRLFSGLTTSILQRAPTTSEDAVIGLSFFLTRGGSGPGVHLVTLTMKGQLLLWSLGSSLENWTDWVSYHCGVVDSRFAVDGYTDSCMLLRKSDSEECPTLVIYLPGDSFRIYKVQKQKVVPGVQAQDSSGVVQPKFSLIYHRQVEFKKRELMDFYVTDRHIFTLVNNPEEETEWEMGAYSLISESIGQNPTFMPALLESLPIPDVQPTPIYTEAKEFYMSLIFNSSSFNASTITKALTMFRKNEDDVIRDRDWDSLKITAMNVIDREIALETSDSEFDISDDHYTGMSLKYWSMFYNSCVEYHIHTVKPLGLFYDPNSGMVCVVKKSRISFLRPTDLLESLYYFPQPPNPSRVRGATNLMEDDVEERREMFWVSKYLGVIKTLESIFNDSHLSKIKKRLRHNVAGVQEVCKEIAQFLLSTDPHCFAPLEKQLVQILEAQLEELGGAAEGAMKKTLELISTWGDAEGGGAQGGDEDSDDGMVGGGGGGSVILSSRLGAHLTHRILQQLMEHRFLVARDTMILQYMLISFFAQNSARPGTSVGGGVQFSVSWDDNDEAKRSTIAYHALLEIGDNFIESVPSFIRERGVKVANILKLQTSPNSAGEKYWTGGGNESSGVGEAAIWPARVVEAFCLSTIGSKAITRAGGGAKWACPPLGFAQAAGKTLWTNSRDATGILDKIRPLEDFLVVGCQYNILLKYAQFMVTNFSYNQISMKQFYTGLSHLCLFNEDVGLTYIRAISLEEALVDEIFCYRILELPPGSSSLSSPYISFYIKMISILQVLEYLPGIQRVAGEGLQAAETEEDAIKMCALAFKCALQLEDYTTAFNFILRMPSRDGEVRGPHEKLASLRTFVSSIVKEGALDILLNLNMDSLFNRSASVREQVEGILFAQANLADPLQHDGVYQMLYIFHLAKDNFHKAAAVMYYRAMRIGDKGSGRDALKAQKLAYLDTLTCLNLIKPENCRNVIKRTGIVRQPLSPLLCFDPARSVDPEDEFPVPTVPREKELIVMGLADIQKEFQVLLMLCKLGEDKPVKPTDFERRATKTVDLLALRHRYDDAFYLASLWNVDPKPIISYFTDVCCNLVHNIMPEGGNPGTYFVHNDTSDLPSSESGYTDLGFRLLQKYLEKAEKPSESGLHKVITLKLLAADIELPQWLVTSYKKRNVRQLLNCLLRYGEWEKGTQLSLKVLDAALGRVRSDEFDGTVNKISAYDPVEPATLPFSDINRLATELLHRAEENPVYLEWYNQLKERSSLYCDRVIECTKERNIMFAPDRK